MLQHSQLLAIRNAVSEGRMLWKKRALERMLERGISRQQVKQAVAQGEVVEQYPDDYPIPSLLMAVMKPEPLHVVLAWDEHRSQCHIITAYRPNLEHFETDLVTRRKR